MIKLRYVKERFSEYLAKKNNSQKLSKKEIEEKKSKRWIYIVTVATFFSTIVVTYISDILLEHTPLLVSFIILFTIVIFGILSDIVGVAITAVNPKPFNSMASQKVFGARTAVKLIKAAPRFSNICNDVIGDICGIVSGATGVAIVTQLASYLPTVNTIFISLIMSGSVAALTVGGKALGKDYAIKNSTKIIELVSRVFASILRIFKGGRE